MLSRSDKKLALSTSVAIFFICLCLAGIRFALEYQETTSQFDGKLTKNERTLSNVRNRVDLTEMRVERTESQHRQALIQIGTLERQMEDLESEKTKYAAQVESLKTQLLVSRKEAYQLKQRVDYLQTQIMTMIEERYARTR